MAEWQSRWLHSTKGRDVYELYKEAKENRIQGDFFLNQLITGHGTIGIHQARLFHKSPSCQCGHSTEDRHHIIYQCPLWNSIRSKPLPLNHSSISMNLIFANYKSKMGLIEIMKIKLQSALQPIEDEDDPTH
ncbi:RNase H domain-containing protein [Caerostris darwini]|uniref:RNase H domain-containing protein n=1 Tax=Caerostris darwini TaxID=1538125 RepID=A0AAV4N0N2_9ARAC|nr:RNase H domain-containing protein [Caerostris darwini]